MQKTIVGKTLRFDSVPLKAQYTEEGYLVDTPILTSVGIFEYTNSDGSVRRELRLPEHVFAKDSLASYEGKPIIITHDAGKVDKNNVTEEAVGTILSKGYRDGNDVRAKIVIHDTNELKRCGLKELSLGYTLDLLEQEGEYEGQHYDAVQTNIVINHLALVANARAGEQARLNIDSADKKVISEKGGKTMAKKLHKDEDDLAVRLAEEVLAGSGKGGEEPKEMSIEEKVDGIRKRCDAESQSEYGPQNYEEAMEAIAHKDEDIKTLLEAYESKQAEKDFEDAQSEGATGSEIPEKKMDAEEDYADIPEEYPEIPEDNGFNPEAPVTPEDNGFTDEPEDEEKKLMADSDEEPEGGEFFEGETDWNDEDEDKKINCDSIDRIIRARMSIARVGERLNLDGLERMSLRESKKAVIKKVAPTMNLDGKSAAYINTAYAKAVQSLNKSCIRNQRKQMTSGQRNDSASVSLAANARAKMIANRGGNK